MRWDARGTIALLVSALVGVTAGVVVGFTTTGERPDATRRRSHTPASTPVGESHATRLRLGVPLETSTAPPRRSWSSGTARPAAPSSSAVQTNSDSDAKYLETAKSCNTLYGAGERAGAQVRRLPRPLRHLVRAVRAADERRPQGRRGHQPQARPEDARPVPVRAAARPTSPSCPSACIRAPETASTSEPSSRCCSTSA